MTIQNLIRWQKEAEEKGIDPVSYILANQKEERAKRFSWKNPTHIGKYYLLTVKGSSRPRSRRATKWYIN